MSEKTHYIFDFDGTVSDSQWFWRRLIPQALLDRGIPLTEEDFSFCKFISSEERWTYLKEKYGLTESDIPTFEELMACLDRYYLSANQCKPGAVEYLKALKDQGKTLAIFTATRGSSVGPALRHLGIDGYFDYVFSARDIGIGKGDPESFRFCLRKMGTTPERCVMVEDSLYSMKTAKSLGIMVYGVYDSCFVADREQIVALAEKYAVNLTDFLEE